MPLFILALATVCSARISQQLLCLCRFLCLCLCHLGKVEVGAGRAEVRAEARAEARAEVKVEVTRETTVSSIECLLRHGLQIV
jgi:hypothetical protein